MFLIETVEKVKPEEVLQMVNFFKNMNLVSSTVSTRFIFKERPGEKDVMSKCTILNFFNMELYLSLIFSALLALISSSGVPLNFLNFRKFKFAFTQICYFIFALYKRWSR